MSEPYMLRSARYIAAECFARVIRSGDIVIDATVGNGHDTLTLARLVGQSGHVYGFDVQQSALDNAKALLEREQMSKRVTLFCDGHERMAQHVASPVRLIALNLGWLPGGDKARTTQTDTTKQAVLSALSLLSMLGVCVICCYPGHGEGARERDMLDALLASLRPQAFNALKHQFVNAGEGAPLCYIIQKQG